MHVIWTYRYNAHMYHMVSSGACFFWDPVRRRLGLLSTAGSCSLTPPRRLFFLGSGFLTSTSCPFFGFRPLTCPTASPCLPKLGTVALSLTFPNSPPKGTSASPFRYLLALFRPLLFGGKVTCKWRLNYFEQGWKEYNIWIMIVYMICICAVLIKYFFISKNIDIIWFMQLIHFNCGGALGGSSVFVGSSFPSCPQDGKRAAQITGWWKILKSLCMVHCIISYCWVVWVGLGKLVCCFRQSQSLPAPGTFSASGTTSCEHILQAIGTNDGENMFYFDLLSWYGPPLELVWAIPPLPLPATKLYVPEIFDI